MQPIGMDTMERIFEVVDDLELSREAIQVPLLPAGRGDVRALPNGRIEIVVPEDDLEAWLPELRRRLASLVPGGAAGG
jgi:hypothetical protein